MTHLPLMLSSRARTIFCSLHNIQLRVEIAGNFFPLFFLSFFFFSSSYSLVKYVTIPHTRLPLWIGSPSLNARKRRNPLSKDGNCCRIERGQQRGYNHLALSHMLYTYSQRANYFEMLLGKFVDQRYRNMYRRV